jgi:hypothetical protein
MKKIIFSALLLCFSALSFSQETVIYDKNVQVRNVSSFTGIKVSSGIQLMIKQGDTEAVAVSASEDEYRDKIKTVVENGVLKIYYDENWLRQIKTYNKKPKAYVTVKTLNRLDGSAGAYIKIIGKLSATNLSVDLSSGSVLSGNITATSISVDQSSGSIMSVSGSAGKLQVEGSSGSIFHGYELATDNCNADTSSGSVVEVTANKEIKAEASSGGVVRYKGSAGLRSVSTSSGGSVNKRG